MDLLFALAAKVEPRMAVLALVILLVLRSFVHIVNDPTNDLEWDELISSRGEDGKQHIDINQIGLLIAVVLSPIFVGYAIVAAKPIDFNTVLLFFGWLVFSAGVKMFATWFRGFLDRRYSEKNHVEKPEEVKP